MNVFLPWLWLAALCAGIVSSANLAAADSLDPDRIRAIAGLLPESPAGFAWPVTNRVEWQRLAANAGFAETVSNAETLLGKPSAAVPDSLYLEYSRDGNRTHWQDAEFERRDRLARFTLAEVLENRGRFLPALEKLIAALCAEKTWVLPAHDAGLKNFNGEKITPELGATGLAAELAEADYLLGDELSPATRRLIRDNVRQRVLMPVRGMVEGREPAWWLRAQMNWNAVCVGNTVFAALALEPAREDRAFFAALGEHYIKYFLNGFGPDGYCAEGVGYWNYGYGHFILLTEALRQATGGKIDLFDDDRAIAAGLFCRRSEILSGIFPSISDCVPGSQPSPRLAAYVSLRLGLDAGANRLTGEAGTLTLTALLSSLGENLPAVRRLNESANPPRSFFPHGGVLICRDAESKPAFAACLKGGNNDEPHNHNDVGSFSVVAGATMIVCDPGGEVYTSRTFGPHRYDSAVLNSYGHAVPVVAGKLQRPGADARAVMLATNFSDAADVLKLDLRSAYSVPELRQLERTFTFRRGATPALEVRDEVAFSSPEKFETALITWGRVKAVGTNSLQITDGDAVVRVNIDTQGRKFTWRAEKIDEDVHTGRKPVHVGIRLKSEITNAVITLQILPEVK
jgi:hypothetical protein